MPPNQAIRGVGQELQNEICAKVWPGKGKVNDWLSEEKSSSVLIVLVLILAILLTARV